MYRSLFQQFVIPFHPKYSSDKVDAIYVEILLGFSKNSQALYCHGTEGIKQMYHRKCVKSQSHADRENVFDNASRELMNLFMVINNCGYSFGRKIENNEN